MSDVDAINVLAARYSDAASRLDGVAAAGVYAEDGVLMAFSGPPIVGRPAIEAALSLTLAPLDFLSQQCTGGMITVGVDGNNDRAVARWNVQEWTRKNGEDQLSCCFGIYEDELVRTAAGWRFSRRRFHPFYRGRVEGKGRLYDRPVIEHPEL